MRNETYEILLRCYSDAREGFGIIKSGVVHYANRALVGMAGRDVSGMHVEQVFPPELMDGIDGELSKKESVSVECAEVFGKRADIRAFKYRGMTVLIFSDLDAVAQELRKNEESFKILKGAYRRLTDSITAAEEYIDFLNNPQVEDMDRMFKKYGNSLYLVRRLAMFYDGSMQVENTEKGKKIIVKLPKVQVAPHVQQKLEPLGYKNREPWWERI